MHPYLLLVVLAAVKSGSPTIKSVAVAGPVVGSQETLGRVDLTAPAALPVVITLTTSDLQRGRPPASVTVPPGQTMLTFVLKTEPVAAPTTMTLTARTSDSSASTTFNVIPPALAILDCEPKSVAGDSTATCKVWMNGVVAAGATPQIAISSSNPQVISLPSSGVVVVPSGSKTVTFDAYPANLPQSASATISATYAGITKTSSIAVTPTAISSFGCVVTQGSTDNSYGISQCTVIGGDSGRRVGWAVHLTASAPSSGYKIPLTNSAGQPVTLPFGMTIDKTLEVQGGKKYAFFPFYTTPVEKSFIIKVSAKDPITHNSYNTQLEIDPPNIREVSFATNSISNVPLGGKDVTVQATFATDPPKHGIAYDVTYAGTTDIKGPARVRIDPGDYSKTGFFTVKVFPCALNPPCHVSATLANHTGTMTVNP